MSQSSYLKKLDLELERIFELQPNNLHVPALTYMYKKLTRPLKSLPIVYIVPLSIGSAIFMYLVFGPMVVRLVSLLQYGF